MTKSSAHMKLGMFYWPGGGQHMAAWRHPDAHPDFDIDIRRIIDLAKLAERGLFDMLFMADSLTFWRGPLEAMSHDATGSWIARRCRRGTASAGRSGRWRVLRTWVVRAKL